MYRRLRPYMPPSSSSSSSSSSAMAETATAADKQKWKEIQFKLKEKLITRNDFGWKVPSSTTTRVEGGGGRQGQEFLKYVGGVDISYCKEDPSVACGTIVVLDIYTLKVVYQDHSIVTPQVPYVAGFLAFREVPILKDLLEKMKRTNSPYYPQIVMVDGNGILHPRGFGSASQLGVLANIPTIGVGKNLHYVDGLSDDGVDKLLARGNINEDFFPLKGRSGRIWGAAMRPTKQTQKPIFISIGHRVSLDTAIKIVNMTCKYRVPEPIRQADLISREHIKNHERALGLNNIVNGMRRMEIHGENQQRSRFGGLYSGSSQRSSKNWWVQSGWQSSGQSSRGSYSQPFNREVRACFECGEVGHFKRDCPELQR